MSIAASDQSAFYCQIWMEIDSTMREERIFRSRRSETLLKAWYWIPEFRFVREYGCLRDPLSVYLCQVHTPWFWILIIIKKLSSPSLAVTPCTRWVDTVIILHNWSERAKYIYQLTRGGGSALTTWPARGGGMPWLRGQHQVWQSYGQQRLTNYKQFQDLGKLCSIPRTTETICYEWKK